MEKRKLILRNFLSPGDLVMLTAAVRDLHRCYPGRFLTDVRSSCPELWEHNPYLTPLRETEPLVEQIDCHYPLIDRSNEAPYHCIHGFTDFLSTQLKLSIRPTHFCGDIHLSADERRWKSTVHELAGIDLPFWIVNAGGKFDFTIKWWDWKRYQRVIDHFHDRILFVQVGEIGHYHPPLKNVVDLRGKTDLRQLVRLVYHSQGVLCGVTALMHLAAAIPTRVDRPSTRAGVIIAGGREPTHWEAYPHHQFVHTIGALSCCTVGGCWRARTRALGDGEESDRPENLCTNIIGDLPRCMDMITPEEITRRIELYFHGVSARYLTVDEQRAARRAIAKSLEGPRFETTINLATAPSELEKAACEARTMRVPAMKGQGILLFAHAVDDFVPALAALRTIRALGSGLPVECWMNERCARSVARTFRQLDATIHRVSADSRPGGESMTRAELRLHALMQTQLRDVMTIDAGNFPLCSPDIFFGVVDFTSAGVLFVRRGKCKARPGVWKLCGLDLPTHTASDAVMLMDRRRSWPALYLWRWITERMYFFSGYVEGDGGAAQLAFQKLNLRTPMSWRMEKAFWSVGSEARAPLLVRRELQAAQLALAQ